MIFTTMCDADSVEQFARQIESRLRMLQHRATVERYDYEIFYNWECVNTAYAASCITNARNTASIRHAMFCIAEADKATRLAEEENSRKRMRAILRSNILWGRATCHPVESV